MKIQIITLICLASLMTSAQPKSSSAEFAKAQACQQMFPESTQEREVCYDRAAIKMSDNSFGFVIELVDEDQTKTTCKGFLEPDQTWTVTDCW